MFSVSQGARAFIQWKGYLEGGSRPIEAACRNGCAMGYGDPFADGQSEPGALLFAARSIYSKEAIEDEWKQFFGDSDPIVGDSQLGALSIAHERDLDAPTARCT